jgi:hypothetical protein
MIHVLDDDDNNNNNDKEAVIVTIYSLPLDILYDIFLYHIRVKDIIACSTVCRQFHSQYQNMNIWKNFLNREYSHQLHHCKEVQKSRLEKGLELYNERTLFSMCHIFELYRNRVKKIRRKRDFDLFTLFIAHLPNDTFDIVTVNIITNSVYWFRDKNVIIRFTNLVLLKDGSVHTPGQLYFELCGELLYGVKGWNDPYYPPVDTFHQRFFKELINNIQKSTHLICDKTMNSNSGVYRIGKRKDIGYNMNYWTWLKDKFIKTIINTGHTVQVIDNK